MSCSEAIELDEDSLDAIEDCEPFAVAPEVSVLDLMALRARPARGPLKWVGGLHVFERDQHRDDIAVGEHASRGPGRRGSSLRRMRRLGRSRCRVLSQ
jgi:hypothetical protein